MGLRHILLFVLLSLLIIACLDYEQSNGLGPRMTQISFLEWRIDWVLRR